MKKIVLKISLILIASCFSAHIYPAGLAAKETPGGGAAPAEESFSGEVSSYNKALNKALRSLQEQETLAKEMRKINTKEFPEKKKKLHDKALNEIENSIKLAKESVTSWIRMLKRVIEEERQEREKKTDEAEKTEE